MRRVVLVAGPPCAGKTTWVKNNSQPTDLILDHDLIAASLGSRRRWHHDPHLAAQAQQVYQTNLIRIAKAQHGHAWIVRCLPDWRERQALAAYLNAEVMLIDPGLHECIRRARRDRRPRGTERAIRSWYAASQQAQR